MTARCLGVRAAAALLAGVLLAGCEPATSTQTGTAAGGCDPNGWGPLSGCDDTGSTHVPPAPAVVDPDAVCPDYEYATFDYPTGRLIELVGAREAPSPECVAALEAEGDRLEDAFNGGGPS